MIKSHPQWENILDSYFKSNGFVKQQLESYNEFVEYDIQKILNEMGPIEINTNSESRGGEMLYTITFGKISLKKPVIREHDGTTNILYPQEARNRSLTYHSALYCDISVKTHKKYTGEETINVTKEQLGFIPIMVHSKFCLLNNRKTEKQLADLNECIYDEGGYFIVSGNEKVVIAQERMPYNEVFCFYKKPPSKIIWQAEIRSQFEYHIKSTSTLYVKLFSKGARTSNNTPTFTDIDGLRVQITYIRQDIPIIFMFYALGYTNDDIIEIITNSSIMKNEEYNKNIMKFMRCSFDEADKIMSEDSETTVETTVETKTPIQEFALEYIGKKGSTNFATKEERIKYAIGIINKELLPHLHIDNTSVYSDSLQLTKSKAHFIGYIINKLYLCYIRKISENDRDHLANKRMELTGNLMANLFKTIFKRVHKEAKVILTKSIESNNTFDLVNAIKSKSITNDIKYALSTGNWGRQTSGTAPKMGVAQQLSRLTYSSTLSHLRRLNTPLNREGKQAKPRQLHGTHYGFLCPAETPEGQGCGLLKNMAIMCHISIGSKTSFKLIIDYLTKHEFNNFMENRDLGIDSLYKVFVDGMWIISVDFDSVKKLNKKFVDFRRKLIVHYDTSICLDDERREMSIYTGAGRCCRPLLIVENLYRLEPPKERTWIELLIEGIVEYIDVSEEEETTIAMDLNSLNKDPKKYTHMEIHPSVMLGICASIIPFSNHNQCLGYEEFVLMADGTQKMIKDVKIDDMVYTFNPDTLERSITKVVHHYVNPTQKNMYKITLYDGKSIIATYDHRFYTDKGFERVQFFNEGTKLGTDVDGKTVFVSIKSIEPYTECNIIADITVESENHSFIASGILSSNSPRNIYQSLHPDTTVLMADGTQKPIKNVKVGDSVVTFDHDTLNRTYSKVIQQYVKETENKMYKITTISGREIIATDNHSFFTSDGFKEVKYFDENTLLGIDLKNKTEYINEKVKILDESVFVSVCKEYEKMKNSTILKYIEKLKPWFGEVDVNKVAVLSGIIGYLLADGYLHTGIGSNNRAGFIHSSEEGANQLINDMEYIGFERKNIKKGTRTDIFGKDTYNPREITQTTYDTYYYGNLPLLLESLGVTTGKRSTQDSTIPNFILNGHKEIQRSFLSGLFGGDGCAVRYDIVRNGIEQIEMKYLSMTKDSEHIKSLELFMKHIQNMLNKFDIKTNYIHTFDSQYNKKVVRLGFDKSFENIIKFYEEIGFKYDVLKNEESGLLVEFLKYKKITRNKKIIEIHKIRKDIEEKLSNDEIIDKYKKTKNEIINIKDNKHRKIDSDYKIRLTPNKDFMSIKKFTQNVKNIRDSNTLYIPIEKIEEYTESKLIADITVEDQEKHDFVANGFLVHNSSMGKQAMG